jgi:hypothetical protein
MAHDVKTKTVQLLIAKKDLDIPGLGRWKHGEEISSPILIDALKGNPNFEAISKEALQ